jgi:hypothetical protein
MIFPDFSPEDWDHILAAALITIPLAFSESVNRRDRKQLKRIVRALDYNTENHVSKPTDPDRRSPE